MAPMRVRRAVDLSLAVDPDTQVYPGDPVVRFGPPRRSGRTGSTCCGCTSGRRAGRTATRPTTSTRPGPASTRWTQRCSLAGRPDRRAGPRGAQPGRARPRVAVPALARPRYHRGALDGLAAIYGTPAYFDHPYLTAAACEAILATGVRTVLSTQLTSTRRRDASHPGVTSGAQAHRRRRRDHRREPHRPGTDHFADPFLAVFPLRLTGADGSPTRAVALDLETI